MNPSHHAKIELREMRLRRMPKVIRALARWYLTHHVSIKVAMVAALFMFASRLQHQSELADEREKFIALGKQVAASKAFDGLPDKTFVLEARNFDDAREKWQSIERAAVAKQAEMMAAKESK